MTQGSNNGADTIFQSDHLDQHYTYEQLKHIAEKKGQELTFTCVPPGSGFRIGIDRDEDGIYDTDETFKAYPRWIQTGA